jgi:hypothetical protein
MHTRHEIILQSFNNIEKIIFGRWGVPPKHIFFDACDVYYLARHELLALGDLPPMQEQAPEEFDLTVWEFEKSVEILQQIYAEELNYL